MQSLLDSLRAFTFPSVFLRMFLAILGGFVIGFGRTKKNRPAGFRTYMLISTGAALAMILELYEFEMLNTGWAGAVEIVGMRFDASRYCASVISGIGFLGAGTILAGKHRQVAGLSTATGLLASAGIGIAAGAGFYECAVVVIIAVVLVMEAAYPLEPAFKRKLRNITLYVELENMADLSDVTELISSKDAKIFDIDLDNPDRKQGLYPSVILDLRMSRTNASHSDMLSSVAELPCVHRTRELIY